VPFCGGMALNMLRETCSAKTCAAPPGASFMGPSVTHRFRAGLSSAVPDGTGGWVPHPACPEPRRAVFKGAGFATKSLPSFPELIRALTPRVFHRPPSYPHSTLIDATVLRR